MTTDNQADGFNHYITGVPKDQDWFAKQWLIWPERADPKNTTNISFLFGGALAYLTLNERFPPMSPDFNSHFDYLYNLGDAG